MRWTVQAWLLVLAASIVAEANAIPSSPAALAAEHRGRPEVVLNRLDFPDVPGAPAYRKHLERALARAARDADWGAGRRHRIEYRIQIRQLTFEESDGVLRVRCAAVGRLPKGKAATSQLSFGGNPSQRAALVKQVLEIVARGVITRLAEIERARRTARD